MRNLMEFKAADSWLKSRVSVPTDMTSAQLAMSPDFPARVRAHAFFSARVTEANILEALREQVDQLAAGEINVATARMRLKTFLAGQGIPADDVGMTGKPPLGVDEKTWKTRKSVTNLASTRRLDLILRQNSAMAHAVGRREVSMLPSVRKRWPYFRYLARPDARSTHGALRNLVLPKQHPFWNTHTPPWDFNCRCDIEDADGRDAATHGTGRIAGTKIHNPATGQTFEDLPNESGFVFDVEEALSGDPDGFDWGSIKSAMLREVVRERVVQKVKQAATGPATIEALEAYAAQVDLPNAQERVVAEIADGLGRVLDKPGNRVGRIIWKGKKGRHNAAYVRPVFGHQPGVNDRLEFQKSYAQNPAKRAATTRARFAAGRAEAIDSVERNLHHWSGSMKKQMEERLDVLRSMERYSVPSVADNPLVATSAHEAGHVIQRHHGLERAWENALQKHGVTAKDKAMLSEYGATENTELFAEATAAHAMNMREIVPDKILRAFDDVTKGIL